MLKPSDNSVRSIVRDYLIITAGILIMTIGVYFFKFPNHFAFGGVTGFSAVVSVATPLSATDFTFIANMILLVIGFIFVGKGFGVKTVYASVLMSLLLELFEAVFPMSEPMTAEPLLELVFAILLPAIGSAFLFEVGASSGGTDIIAMILKKKTSVNIGTALMMADVLSVAASFVLLGPATGLFSVLGLFVKCVLLDSLIENIRLCKCFTIVCNNPEPILEFIMRELDRGATVYDARGAYSHTKKTIILTTVQRRQGVKLKAFIHAVEPDAFLIITNSSEIIGKGFLNA